jgi:hypothetical protein
MTDDRRHASVAAADERDLVAQLAEAVLERTAPEELVLFSETAEEYFDDPEAVLDPKHRDEAVGFGLDLALLTPFVLAVATPVVRFLLDAAADALQDEAKASIITAVRRLVRRDSDAEPPAAGQALSLSTTQLSSLRDLAYSRARAVGVAEAQAALIADAVVGGVVT